MTERKALHADMKILARTFDVLTGELEKTLPSLTVLVCFPDEMILKEGEKGSEVYVALEGKLSVRQSRLFIFSKEVAKLGPGDLFGEIGFLVPTTRSASVIAMESAEVARIGLHDFKVLLEAHPELRARVEEMARRRLYSLQAASHN